MAQIANGESGASVRAKLNALLPQPIAFATAVPLDGRKVMAPQAIAGALAFAPAASPALGGECFVRLTADGANAPTFAGFAEHGSSAGFFNTAGVVNLVRFWFDGTAAWFAIGQALDAVPFAIASASVPQGDAVHIVLGFDRDMFTGAVPAASAFSLTNSGGADAVTGSAWSDARTLKLAKSRATLAADTLRLAYTPPAANALADTNGNVAGGSSIGVTNAVAAAASVTLLRLVNRTAGMVETADGAGFDYNGTATSGYSGANAKGYPAVTLPAGADGWAGGAIAGVANDGPLIGLSANLAPAGYDDVALALFISSSSGVGNWSLFGSGATATGTVAAAAGDVARVRRAGTTLYAEVSKDGGASWVEAGRLTNAPTAALRPFFQIGNNAAASLLVQPRASANVA